MFVYIKLTNLMLFFHLTCDISLRCQTVLQLVIIEDFLFNFISLTMLKSLKKIKIPLSCQIQNIRLYIIIVYD